MSKKPTWHFPPRGWGLDVIQDSSSTHFRDDPISKLVREVLQNSLDANDGGLVGPVRVEIAESYVDGDSVGAEELTLHLESCLERARLEDRSNVQTFYLKALRALESDRVRCLKIVDTGTLGLIGRSWDALVFQEGSVQKSGAAPGGSNGVGKNAVLNVSDLRTVFYSTRYIQPREGRVEKFQGKATLMDHPDPHDKNESLQHVGFYSNLNGQPVLTTEIPDFFRLDEVGTGVFVMGFNPRSREWSREVTEAVIENFFYAIHHKKLVVTVKSELSETTLINHETLDWLFQREAKESPGFHYYKAIRDQEARPIEPIGKIGPLGAFVSIGSGPRRTAYINRNGMLITDSREQKVNPIAPRGKSLWPDYCVVVTPDSDKGDEWIRQTENTSHDSMSPRQCFEGRELAEAERWFRQARKAIGEVVDDAAQVQKYGDTTNLSELAAMFPDEFDPETPGNKLLKTKTTNTRLVAPQPNLREREPGYDPEPEPGPGPEPGPEPKPGSGPRPEPSSSPRPGPEPRPEPGSTRSRRPRIERPRLIPTERTSAIVAFTPTDDCPHEVTIRLRPAGGEWGRERLMRVIDAKVIGPPGQEVGVRDGAVHLTVQPNARVVVEIETSDPLEDFAFRIG